MRHAARLAASLAAVGALIAIGVGGSSAAGIQHPVVIVVDTEFTAPVSTGTFTTRGAPLCDDGTVTDELVAITSPRGLRGYHVHKTFTCTGGEDWFVLDIQARDSQDGVGTYGTWTVLSASQAFGHITGNGNLVGIGYEGGIVDTMLGMIVRD